MEPGGTLHFRRSWGLPRLPGCFGGWTRCVGTAHPLCTTVRRYPVAASRRAFSRSLLMRPQDTGSPIRRGDGPGGTGCGHLRTANLPTVGIPSNPVELRRCRGGCNAVETVCHILQACPVAHDSRVHRHNAVATKIAVQCRKDGREVLEEPHIRHPDGTLYKPDLIVFRSPTDAIVCDVQVSWEVGPSSAEVWRRKRDVYGNPKFLEAARRRWPGTTFEFLPLIVGARGVWPSCNAPTSQALRIHAGLRRSCVAAVLKWGCSAHRSFMKRVWKDGATRRFRMGNN
jgi:hypothetical protein